MGVRGQDGNVVQLVEHTVVAGVAQVFDDEREVLVDFLYAPVVAGAEKDVDGVGPAQQMVLLTIGLDVGDDGLQLFRIGGVVGLADDHLLVGQVSFLLQAEQFDEEEAVGIDVEDGGVVVRLVGEENGQGREHHHGDGLAVPDSPVIIAGHAHA